MSFSAAIAACFSKYATFSGRARRSEYWWFYLFNVLGSVAAAVVDAQLENGRRSDEFGVIGALWALAMLLPGMGVSWRRLHDTGRSGWWIGGLLIASPFLGFFAAFALISTQESGDPTSLMVALAVLGLPLLGWMIAMLVFLVSDGTPGPNAYGPDPKGRGASTEADVY